MLIVLAASATQADVILAQGEATAKSYKLSVDAIRVLGGMLRRASHSVGCHPDVTLPAR
jgi:hypothetical protein